MLREEVLALLKARQGAPLSGEAMSQMLGVSRAAVWKAMEALRQEGYVISSAPRRGYALEDSPDRLSPGELMDPNRQVGKALVCLDTVDSTNNEVKRRAVDAVPDGLAVVAAQQTGGRGRRGRTFVSPPGGLYLSALLRPQCPLEQVSALTAWSAVAVCDAIQQVCGVRPGVKWPNDVILEGRKLCGILTELELEAETAALRYVVVGIGVNLSQTEADFGPEVAPVAISLAQALGTAPGGRRGPPLCWTLWTGWTGTFLGNGTAGWSGTGRTVSPWASRCRCSKGARPAPVRRWGWTTTLPWWSGGRTVPRRPSPPGRSPSGACWGMCKQKWTAPFGAVHFV